MQANAANPGATPQTAAAYAQRTQTMNGLEDKIEDLSPVGKMSVSGSDSG